MKLRTIKSKRGGFSDLFILMIFSVIILLVSGIMIYLSNTVYSKIQTDIGNMTFRNSNVTYSATIAKTLTPMNTAFNSLYWVAFFLIGSMVISIIIGSYMVTTRPVMFVPYFILMIVAVIVSVGVSNAYETIATSSQLAPTFSGFIGSNIMMSLLPIWITVIGFLGGIIMYVRFQIASQTIELGGQG
jgi:hypothetical protein